MKKKIIDAKFRKCHSSQQRKNRLLLLGIACVGLILAMASCVTGSRANQMPVKEEVIVYTRSVQEYEVQFGDSVSKIASQFCPEYIDFYEYQRDFMRLNSCDDEIYYGEVVKVYAYKE